MGKKLLALFMKRIAKTNQKEFTIEKVIKRKGNKLYFKWKGYDNLFTIWIGKSDLIQNESILS